MKAFEFRLERIAEYRREEAELSRTRLLQLLDYAARLEQEKRTWEDQTSSARQQLMAQEGATGEEFAALARFQSHVRQQIRIIERKQLELDQQVAKQRAIVQEAERRVKLLDRLKDRKYQEWRAASDRELESLAADSYLARLAANRSATRQTAR